MDVILKIGGRTELPSSSSTQKNKHYNVIIIDIVNQLLYWSIVCKMMMMIKHNILYVCMLQLFSANKFVTIHLKYALDFYKVLIYRNLERAILFSSYCLYYIIYQQD